MADVNKAGVQLSPAQSITPSGGAALSTLDALARLGSRLDAVRTASAGDSGVATGEAAPDRNLWGQITGGHANQGAVGQVDGYGADYGGLLLGADRMLNDQWRGGGAFTYSNTHIDGRGNLTGSATRANGYGLLGYAGYTGAAWFLNLSAGVVRQQYDTSRAVSFTGFSGQAQGRSNGWQQALSAEVGQPLAVGDFTMTPTMGLTYLHQSQNSYTETGGNGAALTVADSNGASLRSALGVRLERSISSAYGKLLPYVQLKWLHEYRNNAVATSARFAGDTTGETSFTTVGAVPVRNLADLSLGVTLLQMNNLTLAAQYSAQVGPHFVSQTGSVRLRQAF